MNTNTKIYTKAFLTAFMLFSSAICSISQAKSSKAILLSPSNHFRKIIVKGLVEVMLVQQGHCGIVYSDDNTGTVKVSQQGENLNIVGKSNELSKVIVYVTDLYRIEAEDYALIRSASELNFNMFQLILTRHASADLHIRVKGLRTQVFDSSNLTLQGFAGQHYMFTDRTARIAMVNFSAIQTESSLASILQQRNAHPFNSVWSSNNGRSSISLQGWYNAALLPATFRA